MRRRCGCGADPAVFGHTDHACPLAPSWVIAAAQRAAEDARAWRQRRLSLARRAALVIGIGAGAEPGGLCGPPGQEARL